VPEEHFGVVGDELGGGGVFTEGALVVLGFDGEVALVHVVVGTLEGDEAAEFLEGFGVVVDAEVEDSVEPGFAGGFAGDDDEGGGLFAADIAADGLGGIESGEHAAGEVAMGLLEGFRHRGPDFVVEHEIGLDGVVVANDVTGGGDVLRSGVGGDAALGVDHGDLANVAAFVGEEESFQGVGGGAAGPHEVEAELAVAGIDEGLGGDGADSGFGPGDRGADGEPVGLNGDAEFAGCGVAGHDGEGVDGTLGCGGGAAIDGFEIGLRSDGDVAGGGLRRAGGG